MPSVKSVAEADVKGKRVLLRCDFNVPLDLSGGRETIVDDLRIKAAVPTIKLLHERGATKIILLTHVGRPGGKVMEALRVAPVAARLHELLPGIDFEVKENLRFDPREEANDSSFAKELAPLGDIYVNEAFPVSHRSDTSIVSVPKLLPSYAGLQFMKEVEHLSAALEPPEGSVAVIGGAKFKTKEPLIKQLLAQYATMFLGGALGNDVLKARGMPVGASLTSGTPVPTDIAGDMRVVVANDAVVRDANANAERTALITDTQAGEEIVDIGPLSAAAWAAKVAQAPFVLWSGPLGIYEQGFARGTDAIAEALTKSGVKAVVGGGDTLAALAKFTFDTQKVFVSTGGGAMLEFLVQGTLPGIEALKH